MARTKPISGPTCDWREDEDGNWDTGCGQKHVLLDGGPTDNHMRYCCYCGSRLRERRVRW